MPHIGNTSEAAIKRRMRERADALSGGKGIRYIEERTKESYKNVQRWVGGQTTVPAEFVARYITSIPVDPVWLLTGRGRPEPTPEPPSASVIRRIRRTLAALDRITLAEYDAKSPPGAGGGDEGKRD